MTNLTATEYPRKRKMKVDFKKELETASKGMIMIHDANLLIRLIVRMLVRKLGIKHAGMILYDPQKSSYVLNISRGAKGEKIPSGFMRFGLSSPIIRVFTDPKFRSLALENGAIVCDNINRLIWRETVIDTENKLTSDVRDVLHEVDSALQMLNSVACVPSFYQDRLMAVLLLGEKQDGEGFEKEELDFFSALASDAAMAIRNAQLFDSLKQEAERNHQQFMQTIKVLGSTIEAKDAYTHGHTERVTKYSLAIARQMEYNGSIKFPESFYENLYIAGTLHDIGKIGVPESILNKQGGLTDEEYQIMKSHTTKGVEIVKNLDIAQECIDGVHYHHERFDGKGYPQGLLGKKIPIIAAIIAVADTYDAMTTDRPYRKGMKKETAIKEIQNNAGIQFDPIPVKAFVELVKRREI